MVMLRLMKWLIVALGGYMASIYQYEMVKMMEMNHS